MKVSEKGLNIIKEFEGCQLTAYKCPAGVWTIGWGTTNADKALTGFDVREGKKISKQQADSFLETSVNAKYAKNVNKYADKYKFNQNQFDALVSFAYNIGSIDQLTANGTRSISEISNKILAYNKANGKELPGLTRRRKAEKELFDTPVKKAETKKTEAKKVEIKPVEPKKAEPKKVETKSTEKKVEKKKEYQVKVSIRNLNIRKGPGTNYGTIGRTTGVGTFTIVDTKEGKGSKTGWGKLKSGLGWISLDFAKKL